LLIDNVSGVISIFKTHIMIAMYIVLTDSVMNYRSAAE